MLFRSTVQHVALRECREDLIKGRFIRRELVDVDRCAGSVKEDHCLVFGAKELEESTEKCRSFVANPFELKLGFGGKGIQS